LLDLEINCVNKFKQKISWLRAKAKKWVPTTHSLAFWGRG
jgi:hypothetical protein